MKATCCKKGMKKAFLAAIAAMLAIAGLTLTIGCAIQDNASTAISSAKAESSQSEKGSEQEKSKPSDESSSDDDGVDATSDIDTSDVDTDKLIQNGAPSDYAVVNLSGDGLIELYVDEGYEYDSKNRLWKRDGKDSGAPEIFVAQTADGQDSRLDESQMSSQEAFGDASGPLKYSFVVDGSVKELKSMLPTDIAGAYNEETGEGFFIAEDGNGEYILVHEKATTNGKQVAVEVMNAPFVEAGYIDDQYDSGKKGLSIDGFFQTMFPNGKRDGWVLAG